MMALWSHVAMIVAFCLLVGLYPDSGDNHLFNAVRRANVQYSMNWFGVADVGQDDARALLGDAVNEKDFRHMGAGTCVRIRGECKVPFEEHSKTQGRFAYAVITWHAVSFIEHLVVWGFLGECASGPRFAPLFFLGFILCYAGFGIWIVLFGSGRRKDDFVASDALSGIPLFCGLFVGLIFVVARAKNVEHLDEIYHFQSIRWLSYGITASIMTAANYAFSWESTSAELLVLTIGLVWSYILCGAASDLLSQVVRHRARRRRDGARDRDCEDAFMLCAIRLALLSVGGVAFVASFVPAFVYAYFASTLHYASDCGQSGQYAQWLNASTYTCRNHGDFYGGSSSCKSGAMLWAVLTTVVKVLSYLHFPFIKMYYNSLLYEETNEMDKLLKMDERIEEEKRSEEEEDSKKISMLQLQGVIAWREEKHFVFASFVSKMVLTAMFVILIRYREDGSLTSDQGLPASDYGYLHGTTARYMSAANGNERSGPPYACNLLQAAGYNYVKSSL